MGITSSETYTWRIIEKIICCFVFDMTVKIEKWVAAKKKHRLSDKHVQMMRELGLNPDKLDKIDNHKQEPWKAPLVY